MIDIVFEASIGFELFAALRGQRLSTFTALRLIRFGLQPKLDLLVKLVGVLLARIRSLAEGL
ncbi:hypothetical protein ACFLU6_13415 [Acidobacteriota bacterium]